MTNLRLFFTIVFFLSGVSALCAATSTSETLASTLSEFAIRSIDVELRNACRAALHAMNDGSITANPTYETVVRATAAGNARTFNWSIGKFKDHYLVAVRTAAPKEPGEIVPGADANSKYAHGKNFWWIDWSKPTWRPAVLFFKADAKLKAFTLLVPQQFTDETQTTTREMAFRGDIRLMNEGERLFTFDPFAHLLALEVNQVIDHGSYGFIHFAHEGIMNWRRGRNYGVISITDQMYSYIDWMTLGKKGVYYRGWKRHAHTTQLEDCLNECSKWHIKYVYDPSLFKGSLGYDDHITKCVDEAVSISIGRKPIDGGGSMLKGKRCFGRGKFPHHDNVGVMPLFSFGTPHVKIGDYYLGVGHVKIPTDDEEFSFAEGSNIQTFRAKLYEQFERIYGDKYIKHDAYYSKNDTRRGHIYLMYFYYFKLHKKDAPIDCGQDEAAVSVDESFDPSTESDDEYTLVSRNELVAKKQKLRLLAYLSSDDEVSVIEQHNCIEYFRDNRDMAHFEGDKKYQITSMYISDAFLPIFEPEDSNAYRFSLFFPMGLTQPFGDDDHVLIAAGYGDYSSMLMKLRAKELINLCRHNVRGVDLHDYTYQLIAAAPDGKAIVGDELEKILPFVRNAKLAAKSGCLASSASEHPCK